MAADDGRAEDARFMAATVALGRRGLGRTAPNPSVAALLVRDGVVLSRGVTAPGGRPHAETQAIAAAGEAARGATLYVTLEPCSHHGHTPPCAEAIVEAGLARVVVACGDPDPRVAGRGIARLRAAGIAVVENVGAAEGRRSHRGHILRVAAGRPAVTLKLAETPDGFAAGLPGEPRLRITGAAAGGFVHMARALHDAVLVGSGTVKADDPLLTVRLHGFEDRQPTRIVLDTAALTPPAARLFVEGGGPVLIVAGPRAPLSRVADLREAGADVIAVPLAGDRIDLRAALAVLAQRGFTRLFCEGGPRLASALLAADLVDEAILLTGPEPLAGPGVPALDTGGRGVLEGGRFGCIEDRALGRDRLRRYERADACLPD